MLSMLKGLGCGSGSFGREWDRYLIVGMVYLAALDAGGASMTKHHSPYGFAARHCGQAEHVEQFGTGAFDDARLVLSK